MKRFFNDLFFISLIAISSAILFSFAIWFGSFLASAFLSKDVCTINLWWILLGSYVFFLFFPFIWKNLWDASQGESPAIVNRILIFTKEKLINIRDFYNENIIPSNTFLVINTANLILYFFISNIIWFIILLALSFVVFVFVKILIKGNNEEN